MGPPSYTADFLRRRDDSRDMLGRAFQDLPPGTIKTSIRLVTWQLPTMAKLVKWGKEQVLPITPLAHDHASRSLAHPMAVGTTCDICGWFCVCWP